jgi:anti-anti-sigma factor
MAAMAGPEHTIMAANAAYRAFAHQEDLVGRPAGQAFPHLPRQQLLDLFDLVYAAGEPFAVRQWLVGEDRYLDLTVAPWRDPGGGMRGVLVTQVEVTDQAVQGRAGRPPAAPDARTRVRREQAVVQESMLPSGLPVLPLARIAARYLPASADEAAGGDWFDAFPLPDERIAVMVGDVPDRGVAASAAMGRLRAMLRHALMVRPDLATVLAQADQFAAVDTVLRTATLCVAVLRPADGEFSYATCGHPAPLLAAADGTTRFLPRTTASPLGTGKEPGAAGPGAHGAAPVLGSAVLGPGEVLLLYSDGLVERPGRTLDDGMADLAIVAGDSIANRALAAWGTGTPAERASHLPVEMLARGGYRDDVTTVAVWRQPDPLIPLDIEVPASLGAVTTLRRALAGWLDELGAALGDRQLAELAVSEVVTNAVEHAYPPGLSGPVRLEAAVGADGWLKTRVTDRGRWRAPDLTEEERGQGLSMAVQFTEELSVSHPPQDEREPPGARGTVVAMRHRLHRQPMLAPVGAGAPGVRDTDARLSVALLATQPAPRVRVSGPVDHATADQLAGSLFSACRAGVLPLTVDLSDVTILASAGVRTLYRVAAQLAVHGRQLTLISEHGTPAAAVLDLTGLPRTSG